MDFPPHADMQRRISLCYAVLLLIVPVLLVLIIGVANFLLVTALHFVLQRHLPHLSVFV